MRAAEVVEEEGVAQKSVLRRGLASLGPIFLPCHKFREGKGLMGDLYIELKPSFSIPRDLPGSPGCLGC